MDQEESGTTASGDAVDQVRTAVIDLVDEVVSTRRAQPAYAVFTRIDAFAGLEYDDVYRSFVGTGLVLAAEGSQAARAAGRDGAEAVGWVRDNLGAWASEAAARAGAVLEGAPGSGGDGPDLADVQADLREHLLPAVIWFLAGTVAVAPAADGDRLRRIAAMR